MVDIADFDAAAVNAFNQFGDLIKSVTYRQRTAGAYDGSAGTRPVTEADETIRIVAFQDIGAGQRNQIEINLDDQRIEKARAIIIQSEITVTPKIDDEIFTLHGSTWRVERIANINEVLWDLIIRAVKKP